MPSLSLSLSLSLKTKAHSAHCGSGSGNGGSGGLEQKGPKQKERRDANCGRSSEKKRVRPNSCSTVQF